MEHGQCKDYEAMCSELHKRDGDDWLELCGAKPGTEEALEPLMRMYFHTGFADYVLFHSWVPRNPTQYFFTLLAIVAMAQAALGMKIWR